MRLERRNRVSLPRDQVLSLKRLKSNGSFIALNKCRSKGYSEDILSDINHTITQPANKGDQPAAMLEEMQNCRGFGRTFYQIAAGIFQLC